MEENQMSGIVGSILKKVVDDVSDDANKKSIRLEVFRDVRSLIEKHDFSGNK